jgi:GYF domain 2/Bacterial PH domain
MVIATPGWRGSVLTQLEKNLKRNMSSGQEPSNEAIFHILRDGEDQPIGPFSQDELEDLLAAEKILESDLVFYPGLTDWQLVSEAFELKRGPSRYVEDGQAFEVVSESYLACSKRLSRGEEILYIAVQRSASKSGVSAILQAMPKSVVLSNQRITIVTPAVIGEPEFEEYLFKNIELVTRQVNRFGRGSLLHLKMDSGQVIELDGVPDNQLDRLIGFAGVVFQSF